ncbi:hypothetical protein CFC21_034846 [Triticum aestivum]|uniref:F-box domain-containing protein n=3 Tax=Triticum TaxID=4564 RepID=A0A9R0RFB4_TRITD|nr:uncharacterized protein LOC123058181 [Triticum aestivum]KAF7021996.1 hypothetical protein CFC21_034846 [Triticum aestivum]VAH59426.1 unnamed protein product [Triticum turgidum subsp. durum]
MNSRPATMAEAAPPPLLGGLPDEIAIWEILVRLPPKDLLRCRAVCRAWRCTTSTRDFLLTHHARQPSLPLSYVKNYGGDLFTLDIISFDHQGGAATPQTVARLRRHILIPRVSCDGLIVFWIECKAGQQLFICNPATRQYGCLPMLFGGPLSAVGMPFGAPRPVAVGMYSHSPTGEYRLLLLQKAEAPDGSSLVYTYALGSSQPPWHLHIEGPNLNELDYEHEVWAFKYRVEIPYAELTLQFGLFYPRDCVVFTSWVGDVAVLVPFGRWLLQLDVGGKLVASFEDSGGLIGQPYQLKQTLVQHTFFLTLEGYVVNGSPFI